MLLLWLGPVVLLLLTLGPGDVFSEIAVFFSKMAVVTFGGAYAVLAYVAQEAVETYGWPARRDAGRLGMAETTPGPLIMVVQFVGFMGAFRDPGALPPLLAGALGGLLTTWVTFVPCFLWIFLGAPFVETLRGNKRSPPRSRPSPRRWWGWSSTSRSGSRSTSSSPRCARCPCSADAGRAGLGQRQRLARADAGGMLAVFRFKVGMIPVLAACSPRACSSTSSRASRPERADAARTRPRRRSGGGRRACSRRGATPEAGLLLAAALRAFGDGLVSLLLPAYLAALGHGPFEIGLIATATLTGSSVFTPRRPPRPSPPRTRSAARCIRADGADRHRLHPGRGLLAAAPDRLRRHAQPVCRDVSLFLPLEQARLARSVADRDRTALFARYGLVGSLAGAVALCAGFPRCWAASLGARGCAQGRLPALCRARASSLLLYRRLPAGTPGVSAAPCGAAAAVPSHRPHLAALFSPTPSPAASSSSRCWRCGCSSVSASLATAGAIFFWTGLLGAVLSVAVPMPARRIGLVNTMVFTHLPANVCLVLVPLCRASAPRSCCCCCAARSRRWTCRRRTSACAGRGHARRAGSGGERRRAAGAGRGGEPDVRLAPGRLRLRLAAVVGGGLKIATTASTPMSGRSRSGEWSRDCARRSAVVGMSQGYPLATWSATGSKDLMR